MEPAGSGVETFTVPKKHQGPRRLEVSADASALRGAGTSRCGGTAASLGRRYLEAGAVGFETFGGGDFGQGGHTHHFAGEGDEKPGPVGKFEFAYGDGEAFGSTQQFGVVREGFLGFGHANGEFTKTEPFEFGQLFRGVRGEVDVVGSVDPLGDGTDLFDCGLIRRVERLERGGGSCGGDDYLFGERCGATSAVSKSGRFGEGDISSAAGFADDLDFVVGIGVEAVDCHDERSAELSGGVEVGVEIRQARFDGGGVGIAEVGESGAAVEFEGAGGGNDDDGAGGEIGLGTFDMEELFAAEIEAEAGFGDGEIGVSDGHAGGEDGVAAVGDIGEGAAVDEGGHPFE